MCGQLQTEQHILLQCIQTQDLRLYFPHLDFSSLYSFMSSDHLLSLAEYCHKALCIGGNEFTQFYCESAVLLCVILLWCYIILRHCIIELILWKCTMRFYYTTLYYEILFLVNVLLINQYENQTFFTIELEFWILML